MYKKNKHIKHKTLIFTMFILGILISTYLKILDPSKVYITLEARQKMEDNISYSKEEVNKLKALKLEYENKLKDYESVAKDSDKNIKDVINEELDNLKNISGNTNISGKGVTVTIKDSERELAKGQNPNDLLVHDIDILRILNDLKKADVKAISINDERVVLNSKIKCSGATITVNETTYGQPFIIKAIGDVDSLMASMISPQSYANLLKDGYGIYINVEKNDNISINSHK